MLKEPSLRAGLSSQDVCNLNKLNLSKFHAMNCGKFVALSFEHEFHSGLAICESEREIAEITSRRESIFPCNKARRANRSHRDCWSCIRRCHGNTYRISMTSSHVLPVKLQLNTFKIQYLSLFEMYVFTSVIL
jgi:hypothetical protein